MLLLGNKQKHGKQGGASLVSSNRVQFQPHSLAALICVLIGA